MRTVFIIGNWKIYDVDLTPQEWAAEGAKQRDSILSASQKKEEEYKIILCPPFSKLHMVRQALTEANLTDLISLGAQDISIYPPGAHTGDESIAELKKLFGITYTIIGHSERRRDHNETDELLSKKVSVALENDVTPIFCVQDATNPIPDGVTIIAYEPPYAISAVSGGVADDPAKSAQVANDIREKLTNKNTYILYGGSVNEDNVSSYIHNSALPHPFDGVLVGAKSVTPEFFQVIINA